jgi:hypothetical protein
MPFFGGLFGGVEDFLMAEMDAVEVAYGKDGAFFYGLKI